MMETLVPNKEKFRRYLTFAERIEIKDQILAIEMVIEENLDRINSLIGLKELTEEEQDFLDDAHALAGVVTSHERTLELGYVYSIPSGSFKEFFDVNDDDMSEVDDDEYIR
jgi:hypothetical protein